MLKWLPLPVYFVAVLAEPDASCMLQAKHNSTSELATDADSTFFPIFCKQGIAELDFEDFKHGDKFPPNKIKGVTITGVGPKACAGGLQVIDPKKFNFNAPKMLIWSKAPGPQQCDEGKSVITFKFQKLQDVELVDLWDLVNGAEGEAFDKKGKSLGKRASPKGNQMNNKRYTMRFEIRKVSKLVFTLPAGPKGQANPEQGAIQRIIVCRPQGKIFGDPHIYTLEGERFDLYENGTFMVFQYSGQKPALPSKKAHKAGEVDWRLFAHYGGPLWTMQSLLLVDQSMGRFRQALELTAKDCKWRSKTAAGSAFSPVHGSGSLSLLEGDNYVTGFQYFHSKKIGLRMATEKGQEDKMILNALCKPFGINMRISMPNSDEWEFVQGQIEVGNGEGRKKYAQKEGWSEIGGSSEAADFLLQLPGRSSEVNLVSECDDAGKSKARKTCIKHLGKHADEDLLEDCIFDVCRGGEDFAAAAAELMEV